MKKILLAIMICSITVFTACKSGVDGNEVIYEYEEEKNELSPELKEKVGSWAEIGVICYGCVVALDEHKNPINGKPVKAKIVQIKNDGLKLKALQNISVGIGEAQGCTKLGISKGETWWETEGDIFKTREEAESYLKKRGLME